VKMHQRQHMVRVEARGGHDLLREIPKTHAAPKGASDERALGDPLRGR
jgi:hypothetical protein